MIRSKLDVSITEIYMNNDSIDITFSIENPTDQLNVIDISRCTFLDFVDIQSISKQKNNLESIKIKPNSFLSYTVSFSLTDAYIKSQNCVITLDLYDSLVMHHISYSFDCENDDYELKDIYESDHNDPLLEGQGAEAIYDLVSKLKDTLGAQVIVKQINGNELEDVIPKKKNKLLN